MSACEGVRCKHTPEPLEAREAAGLERRKMDGRDGGLARNGWREIGVWIGGEVSGVRRDCLEERGGREGEGRGRRGEEGKE